MNDANGISQSVHLVVIAGDYPSTGHMRLVFVQQLVRAMIDKGVNITVVAPQRLVHSLVYKEKLLPQLSIDTTANGNEYKVFRPYIVTLGHFRFFSNILEWLNSKIIGKLLKEIRPDVLYTHFWSSSLIVNSYARKNGIPLFVACGEGDNALEDMVNSLSSKNLEKISSVVSGVISVSSENKRKCLEYCLAKEDRIGVFPNCVDTNLFKKQDKARCRAQLGLSQEDFVIVFVGGFCPRKGPERLAQAISLMDDKTIKVLFIGKPFPGYPFDFDCPGIVHKGPVEHDKLPLFLNSADIFVLPTQKEGCSNAIVEALSVGLPVVSSKGAFNDDILNENNSIRVNPDDVTAIKDAILKLKNDILLREKMSAFSQKRHKSYSIEGRAQCIIDFINDVLSR